MLFDIKKDNADALKSARWLDFYGNFNNNIAVYHKLLNT